MGKLKYKNYSDEELFAELKDVLNKLENVNLSRKEYSLLIRDHSEILKELRSRGISISF